MYSEWQPTCYNQMDSLSVTATLSNMETLQFDSVTESDIGTYSVRQKWKDFPRQLAMEDFISMVCHVLIMKQSRTLSAIIFESPQLNHVSNFLIEALCA